MFKQTPEMLAAVVQLSSTSVDEDASAPPRSSFHLASKAASENIYQDPPLGSAAPSTTSRLESGLFTKVNESMNNGLCLGGVDFETPIAARDQDHMMGIERQLKPPGAPLRKTRAATVELGSRRGLTSRNSKDINNEVPKRTTSQIMAEAPATRRSTRLLNTKLTSKFVTGGSIADRSGVNTKEREAKKAKAISSRTKTVHVSVASAVEKLGKIRPPDPDVGSIDVIVGIPVLIGQISDINLDRCQTPNRYHLWRSK